MNKSLLALAVSGLFMFAQTAEAGVSATVTAASDYTFNGVSQTGNDPALQGSLDYAADAGWYVGSWASNVDFGSGDDTNLEWDFYAGQYFQLTDTVSLDAGIAYYTYHGDDGSSEYQYPEMYTKFGFANDLGQTELNFWYTCDYFGGGADHYISMVAHTFTVAEGHDIRISFDRSTSMDKELWSWDGESSYNHARIAYMTSYAGFNFSLAAEDTDYDVKNADARVVFSVSRTFGG
ncbi:TorF family putative porin [Shewanella sp.]|uniref:TorF family putative porin n=1 Tax=Shewanella sp. TaxID=50422 RepID=UPI0040544B07